MYAMRIHGVLKRVILLHVSSLFCVLRRNSEYTGANFEPPSDALCSVRDLRDETDSMRARSVRMEVEEDDLSRSLIIDCLGYRQRCSSKSSAHQSRSLL